MYSKLALGNIKKSFKDYAIYFLTLVFGVCVFFAFNSISQQSAVLNMSQQQNNIIELLSVLIGGVSVFIAVVLGFLIVYANRFLIRRRKKEFGIYLTLGMEKSQVSRIITLETLYVGLISLVAGLALGLALSQGLLYLTAALFDVKIDDFTFAFSGAALIRTVLCFALIFLVTLIFNVGMVNKYKLIDLINADRVSETVKLRSLPLSVVLFVVSLVMIGIAYYLLIQNGLMQMNEQFIASTVLVCVGTLLFFFSLSGFLLRAVQSNKGLYWRGLNMFTLRQLNSKINTAFISISIVCMALFLALTSTCGGLAICMTFNADLATTTAYDASLTAYYTMDPEEEPTYPEQYAAAQVRGYDMMGIMEGDIANLDSIIGRSAQTDYCYVGLNYGELLENTHYEFNRAFDTSGMAETMMPFVSLSQFNALMDLTGAPHAELASDEFFIWCDFAEMQGFYKAFNSQDGTIDLGGQTLHVAADGLNTTIAETSSFAMNTGAVVIPDELMPASRVICYSVTNVMYTGSRESCDTQLVAALAAAYGEDESGLISTGQENTPAAEKPLPPYTRYMTAIQVVDQAAGLSTAIAYLAIYIGFVLLIACAAILALQQLSEAADNIKRYNLLEKLGADQKMINKALFVQIGIYFVFPLLVAICHSLVALNVVTDVVAVLGYLHIAEPLIATVALFLVVYGGYFLVTYFASRNMIRPRAEVR